MVTTVAILGNSGSGKSMLAQAVAARLGAEVLDLDTVVWQPGEAAGLRDSAEAEADLEAFLARRSAWVVEGCYGDLIATLRHRVPSGGAAGAAGRGLWRGRVFATVDALVIGRLSSDLALRHLETRSFANGYVQSRYAPVQEAAAA